MVDPNGWLVGCAVFLFIMFVWHYGSGKEYEHQVESKLSHDWLMSSSIQAMGRVPGMCRRTMSTRVEKQLSVGDSL